MTTLIKPTSKKIILDTGIEQHVLLWNESQDDKPWLALVHGFLDSAWSWEHVAPLLTSSFKVIAPDLRGHGDSSNIGLGGYYHFVDYIADLKSLLNKVTHAPVCMVGHSLGGVIASFYAGIYPKEIQSLVLLEGLGPSESSVPLPDRIVKWLDTWNTQSKRPNKTYASVSEAAKRLQKTDPLLSEDVAKRLAGKLTKPSNEHVVFKHDPLHMTRAPYPFLVDTAAQFWQRIEAPTLLVDGEKSRFKKEAHDTERRTSYFPNKSSKTVQNAGHWMQLHQPKAVADLILDHFQ